MTQGSAVPGSPGGKRPGAGRPKGSKARPADAAAELLQARAVKERALAGLREIELKVRRGEVLERATVLHHWQTVLGLVRSRVLAIPTRCAALAPPGEFQRVHDELTRLCHEALHAIADGDGLPR